MPMNLLPFGHGSILTRVTVVMTLLATAAFVGSPGIAVQAQSLGDAVGSEARPPKLPKEERRLLAVRQALGVTDDAEWRALQPHVVRVQALSKQFKDLNDPGKVLEPIKAPKPKDGVTASAPPAYLIALAQHAADLRRAYEDPATGVEDIQKRIARFRMSRDEALRQTGIELASARAEFRELLTARQELAAVVTGLLD
jgi:hypothetical protein